MTVEIVEVTLAQKEAAQLLIRLQERDGDPVDPWTRRVAAARSRATGLDAQEDQADDVVLYLV